MNTPMGRGSPKDRGPRSFLSTPHLVGGGFLLLVVALLVPVEGAAAQETARAHTYVLTDSAKIGERFTIALSAEHAVDTEVVFPDPEAGSVLFGDLTVVDRGPVHVRRPSAIRRVDSVTYEVATFELDSARVPPLPIRVVARGDTVLVNTSSRIVPVTSVVGEKAQGLRDPAALASFPRPLWAWLVLGLVVTALLAGLVYAWRRRQQESAPEIPTPLVDTEERTPYEVATRRLRRLGQRDVADEEALKSFYVDLANILRTYLAEEFGVATLERTTGELIDVLERRPDVPTQVVGRVQTVLEVADLVKFAGMRPSSEDNRMALQEARDTLDAIKAASPSMDPLPTEEVPSSA